MGQVTQPESCSVADCGCVHELDATWEPSYPEPLSYVKPTDSEEQEWETVSQDEAPLCHCGLREDADEFAVQPIYPELGSYVRKAGSMKREAEAPRPQALGQHLNELSQMSRELSDIQIQDMLSPGSLRRPLAVRHSPPQRHPNLDGLFNFTPQFLSSMPGSSASNYVPEHSDGIDVEVKRQLDNLDEAALQELCLRRKFAGVYDVDGRQVSIYWRGPRGSFAQGEHELYVHEIMVGTSDADDLPFSVYLQQVAHVLLSTQRSGASTSGAMAANMTFLETGTQLSHMKFRGGSFSKDRDRAMRVACTQASLRQGGSQEQFGLNGMLNVTL